MKVGPCNDKEQHEEFFTAMTKLDVHELITGIEIARPDTERE